MYRNKVPLKKRGGDFRKFCSNNIPLEATYIEQSLLCLLGLLFELEDGGSTNHRNISKILLDYTMSKPEDSTSVLRSYRLQNNKDHVNKIFN
jgi:hypothetical protein